VEEPYTTINRIIHMKKKQNWFVLVAVFAVFTTVTVSYVSAKCDATITECSMHPIEGGTPTACGIESETWSNGSCGPGFDNYQCDNKCAGNTVTKLNVRKSYDYNHDTGVCDLDEDYSEEVSINCPQLVGCDNHANCDDEQAE